MAFKTYTCPELICCKLLDVDIRPLFGAAFGSPFHNRQSLARE